jgi:hypothetical protein
LTRKNPQYEQPKFHHPEADFLLTVDYVFFKPNQA